MNNWSYCLFMVWLLYLKGLFLYLDYSISRFWCHYLLNLFLYYYLLIIFLLEDWVVFFLFLYFYISFSCIVMKERKSDKRVKEVNERSLILLFYIVLVYFWRRSHSLFFLSLPNFTNKSETNDWAENEI